MGAIAPCFGPTGTWVPSRALGGMRQSSGDHGRTVTRPAVLADRELLQAVGEGSVEALRELVDRHGAAVYSAARLLVGSDSAAEGVAQEVFVRVWRSRGRIDWTGDLRLGLLAMTWCHCPTTASHLTPSVRTDSFRNPLWARAVRI